MADTCAGDFEDPSAVAAAPAASAGPLCCAPKLWRSFVGSGDSAAAGAPAGAASEAPPVRDHGADASDAGAAALRALASRPPPLLTR